MKTTSQLFSNWSEVTGRERNEIVFERLNKTYGAYEIRTTYDNTLLKAFSATGLLIAALAAIFFIVKSMPPVQIEIPKTDIVLIQPLTAPENPVIKQPEQPTQRNEPNPIKNLAPEIRTDDNEEIKTNLTSENTTNNNQQGTETNPNPNPNPNPNTGGGNPGTERIDSIVSFPDDMPEFPGGDEALFAFLKKNVTYPREVLEENGKGIAGISFVIDKEGNVTDATVLKKTKFIQLDEEALRVVKKLPKWNPGKQQGRPVRVRMILPIRFDVK